MARVRKSGVRKRGICRFCDHESTSWPKVRQHGRRGRRVVVCASCYGMNPIAPREATDAAAR